MCICRQMRSCANALVIEPVEPLQGPLQKRSRVCIPSHNMATGPEWSFGAGAGDNLSAHEKQPASCYHSSSFSGASWLTSTPAAGWNNGGLANRFFHTKKWKYFPCGSNLAAGSIVGSASVIYRNMFFRVVIHHLWLKQKPKLSMI